MNKTIKELKNISRYMSLLLRHNPSKENLTLDVDGFCAVNILCDKLDISVNELNWIVDNNDKKRFAYNKYKTLIRASQGHSVDVQLQYEKCTEIKHKLYHGTSVVLKNTILKDGIKKMSRLYVHLSKDIETATKVGKRKNDDIVLFEINAQQMIDDGVEVFISDNGVYLVDFVDIRYISLHK